MGYFVVGDLVGNSIFVTVDGAIVDGKSDSRCRDYDSDCREIAAEGYTLHCWNHDRSRGRCPFVGD